MKDILVKVPRDITLDNGQVVTVADQFVSLNEELLHIHGIIRGMRDALTVVLGHDPVKFDTHQELMDAVTEIARKEQK